MYPLEQNILDSLVRINRERRSLRHGVLPKHVQTCLPFDISEQVVRKYMVRMSRQGDIIRIGGTGARRGYRLPTLVERVAFAVTGMFPVGAEQIAVN
jgi:hypothetical protein